MLGSNFWWTDIDGNFKLSMQWQAQQGHASNNESFSSK